MQARDASEYLLKDVTDSPDLWMTGDPVRPELSAEFKASPGRKVFGLLRGDGYNPGYKAFLCFALTTAVPTSVDELTTLTSEAGRVAVPYTVWSNERGAGKHIVNKVIEKIKCLEAAERVVTLSPLTSVARRFHTKNGATELQVNETTANFEYTIG